MIYDIRVAGIPAKVDVTYYRHQPAMGPRADSDVDCYGYTDMDWTLLDRRGKPAKWLEAKLTPEVIEDINEQIEQAIEDELHRAMEDHAADRYESQQYGDYY